MGRRVVSILMALLGALAVLVANLGWWVDRTFLDEDTFTEEAVELLSDPLVQADVAEELRSELLLSTAVEQLVPGSVAAVVAAPAFRPIYESAIRRSHRFLVDPDVDAVTLTLEGYSDLLASVAGRTDPGLLDAIRSVAADLPGELTGDSITITRADLPDVWDVLIRSRDAIVPAAILGAVLIGLAAVLHPRWTSPLGWAGTTLLVGGAALARVASQADTVVSDLFGAKESVALALEQFTEPLVPQSLVLALVGVVAVAAAIAGRWAAGARQPEPQPLA